MKAANPANPLVFSFIILKKRLGPVGNYRFLAWAMMVPGIPCFFFLNPDIEWCFLYFLSVYRNIKLLYYLRNESSTLRLRPQYVFETFSISAYRGTSELFSKNNNLGGKVVIMVVQSVELNYII